MSHQDGVTRKAHPLKAVMTALFENFFLAASYALFMVQGSTLCTVYQFWKILLKFLAFYSIFCHQFTFEMLKYVNVLGLIEICSFRGIFHKKQKSVCFKVQVDSYQENLLYRQSRQNIAKRFWLNWQNIELV